MSNEFIVWNLTEVINFCLYFRMHKSFIPRGDAQKFIEETSSNGEVVIICGAVDVDLYLAANTKSFLIAAGWVTPEEKVVQYGIPAPTPTKMRALIEIIVNQTNWYYLCAFDDPVPTKVVSLCLSNTYTVSPEEKAMAEAFKAILKYGADNPAIKQALICYLMAAIAHDKDFKEVEDWAVTPSSSTNPPQIMEDLKEHVRCMMNGRKHEAIFIRHTATKKSRSDSRDDRQKNDYCLKHFQSIRVNDKYKGKLKGRVVCVFDDYLTHGNTFEALRNLLIKCEVKKIIFVSIGKFKRNYESQYIQKSFSIEGDVYSEKYTAEFNTAACHEVEFDDAAQRSLENLKQLATYLC
ncbi:uncharacterized protein LOC110053945 [Orbicella faveolata]|uniref:uncharacterized protein LOC110053945 n=1 Tax=Orbicella faveolata TaxID=48498 RepID=UPI0009E5CD68|nr:uncharacterized protein LOC110053945 [Orbicella faveolata]